MPGPDLSGYVEVKDRIAAFHQTYPEGSLQSSWSFEQPPDPAIQAWQQEGVACLIVVEARAYRNPTDPRPGVGLASEPFPGKTQFTRDSELMNAETSAWGRALAALGFKVHEGIASREEVAGRSSDDDRPATENQLNFLLGKGNRKGLIDQADFTDEQKVRVKMDVRPEMGSAKASAMIEDLKNNGGARIRQNILHLSDVPGDTTGLPEQPELKV